MNLTPRANADAITRESAQRRRPLWRKATKMNLVTMWLDPRAKINREHNLFISESKHLYANARGEVHYQKKPLDRRLAGPRKILTRLLVLDVDSGAMYGELHSDATAGELADFLLRAWHPKAGHYFRGIPRRLNVPAKVIADIGLGHELSAIATKAGVEQLGPLPGGFAAGVHALRNFENEIHMTLWQHKAVTLETIQGISALLSFTAAGSAYHDPDDWDRATPLPIAAKEAVQSLRDNPHHWCEGQFAFAFRPKLVDATALGEFKSLELLDMANAGQRI